MENAITKQLCAITVVLFLSLLSFKEMAHGGEMMEISGFVLDPTGEPVPEALVSIVSVNSRGKPVYTDEEGHFVAISVPPLDDQASFWNIFLEIYWNRELIFRKPLTLLPLENDLGTSIGRKWEDVSKSDGFIRLQPIKVGKSQAP
jgi:hypothetical protein